VKYKKEVICNTCKGSGAANDSSVHTCPNCQGSGWIQKVKNTIVGTVVSQEQCSNCSGTGKIVQTVCSTCGGKKVVMQEETVDLNIPRSVRDGDILQVVGAGNVSKNGGINGNLLILIEEEKNEHIFRQESDFFTRHDITICEAILGKELEVNTIEGGTVKVVIPPGTQSGARFRLKEKGLYKMGTNYRGDLYIDVIVFIPTNLSDEEKKIIEKIKDSDNIKPNKK
jgi:molecular chaperone DnaJ